MVDCFVICMENLIEQAETKDLLRVLLTMLL